MGFRRSSAERPAQDRSAKPSTGWSTLWRDFVQTRQCRPDRLDESVTERDPDCERGEADRAVDGIDVSGGRGECRSGAECGDGAGGVDNDSVDGHGGVNAVDRRRKRRQVAQRSLFSEILDYMFAPLAVLWPATILITFLVARSLADAPFDRALEERARIIGTFLTNSSFVEGLQVAGLPRDVVGDRTDGHDAFQIGTMQGRVLAGSADIPTPTAPVEVPGGIVSMRDALVAGKERRIASLYVPGIELGQLDQPSTLLVQVDETLDQRKALANDILRGVIIPQMFILPAAVALIWFGLSRGLVPLRSMQARIRDRGADDYSPIELQDTPDEVAPVVLAFNDLLHRLEEGQQAQRRFVSDAAHQLKTPLAGLRTQAELAMQANDPAELQRSLKQIAQSAERSARMVTQMLALARSDDTAQLRPTGEVDLARLAQDVSIDWYQNAQRAGIDLGYDGPEAMTPIRGEPVLLRELLNNLVDNAIRYVDRKGVVTIRAGATPDRSRAWIAVEDNGPGIPVDEQQRVFDRFYRVLGGTTEGSGLGLAIVSRIARLHRASVQLESPVPDPSHPEPQPCGTRFIVTFEPAPVPGSRLSETSDA